ncbi:MAG: thioredoxin [Candidatus Omnitrophica bacterium]|nr:thioredoxin [Candidatus Omnitrophota bacterium]
MSVVHLNSGNFKTEVLESTLPVLVDFFADWCGPCKMVAPIIEQLAEEFTGKIKIAKLNVDQGQDIAAKYNVMSIPTMIFFKGGKNVDQIVGALPKQQLAAAINKHI